MIKLVKSDRMLGAKIESMTIPTIQMRATTIQGIYFEPLLIIPLIVDFICSFVIFLSAFCCFLVLFIAFLSLRFIIQVPPLKAETKLSHDRLGSFEVTLYEFLYLQLYLRLIR